MSRIGLPESNKLRTLLAAILLCVAIASLTLAVVILGGSHDIPALDIPIEAANKAVKGELRLDLDDRTSLKSPDQLTVFQLKPIAGNKSDVEAIARKFGITSGLLADYSGNRIDGYGTTQAFKDGSKKCFTCDFRTETFHYWDYEKYGRENPDLPLDGDIRRIAVEKLKELGLLPGEAYISMAGGRERSKHLGDGYVTVWLHRNVEVSRKLNDLPVVGPGMNIVVSLGTQGELISLISTMRDVVPYKKYGVKTLEEATRDAQEGNGTMNLHPEVKDPKVTKVELLYYADPAKPENKYLIPVYCFSGPQTCIYVPAVK